MIDFWVGPDWRVFAPSVLFLIELLVEQCRCPFIATVSFKSGLVSGYGPVGGPVTIFGREKAVPTAPSSSSS